MGRRKTNFDRAEARGAVKKHPDRYRKPQEVDATVADVGETPAKDYGAIIERYAMDVVSGRIVVGKYVRAACQRHLDDRAREADKAYPYRFDSECAAKLCGTIEGFRHIKGKWAARKELIRLEPWQCFVLGVPFGWVRKRDGLRRFREIYLEVPRKNTKSTMAACIGNYMLLEDGEYAAEVYAGATSEKQAWEVFGPAKLMLERDTELRRRHGIEVWAKALVKTEDNSRFWPVIGKPGDGPSPSCAIVDEYHEHLSSDLVDTMQTGMGARDQPMMVIITTSGTDLASPCYDKHREVRQLLDGALPNDELFAVIYSIDETDDWADPKTLAKANPNLGVSIDIDFLLAQQRQAVLNPIYQNRFKTKHLDVWCAATVAGINMHAWNLAGDAGLTIDDFNGAPAWFALDLASKLDVCAFVQVFTKRLNDETHYYAFGRYYLPEDTIEQAKANQGAYRKWVVQKHLIATIGAEIDFDQIKADVLALKSQHQVKEIVYDAWRATQLAHQLAADGATCVEFPQHRHHMAAAFDELNAALAAGRFHHDGNPVLAWMAANVHARDIGKGMVIPTKDRSDSPQKIDGIVALCMAISRAIANEDHGSVYETRDALTI